MRLISLLVFLSCVSSVFMAGRAQHAREELQPVNSPYDEQNPVLSPDGQALFFTVGNHPSNIAGKKDPGDIWFSRRLSNGWSAPEHGGAHLNDRGYNAVVGFSPDGRQMFLHGHYSGNAAPARTQGISVTRLDNGKWSRPENINIPYFMNKSGTASGALSVDNSVFVFSADSYGTHGVEDLYVSLWKNGEWSAPKNLGGGINTHFQEVSPWLSDDLKTLYFSSNGRKGNGSFDVYSATRLDDTWMNWSVPENIGAGVNTEGRELYYRYYPFAGFALFTTTKSSDGYGDLRIDAPPEVPPLRDTVIYASLDQEVKNKVVAPADEGADRIAVGGPAAEKPAVVRVYGRILNARTGEPIPARIAFEGPDQSPISVVANEDGYSVEVPSAEYAVRIQAAGYVGALERLGVDTAVLSNVEMNFRLQPAEVGTTVNLKNVLFAQAKTDILPESYPELDLVVDFLTENPKVKIELMGHTDGRGVHADNVRLSQQRVDKVKEYLVSKGIEPRRISGKGYGGSRPIASNDTEETRRMNRRVEFVIRKN